MLTRKRYLMGMSEDASPTRPIRFVHRGETLSVQGLESTTSVLNWLREHAGLTGTKEGCNEGDCGACMVLVGELQTDDRINFRAVNSCLKFLPTLDGKALVTVEDLGGRHPAQQAMVACHGSQCGFCTPGIVMSLAACHDRHRAAGTQATRQQLADDLSGNLCRCTGYRPILDAGEQMFTFRAGETAPLVSESTVAALKALRGDAALQLAAPTPFHAPRSLDDLAALCAAKPGARLLAGGTDVALWVNKQFRKLGEIIYLGEVAELKMIEQANGWLTIGAGVSLAAAWTALARHWPDSREMGLRFASLPVREAGTMGGNVANGSPIGDSAPVLIALGAEISLRLGDRRRAMPLQNFYLDYLRNQLEPGEFVQALHLPLPGSDQVQRESFRVYKLSKRHDCDISGLAAGLWLKFDDDRVVDARFAFGGMAATVRRAAGAEAAVRGQRWTEATVQSAMRALDADFQPLSDLRASERYRRRAARNLLQRLWLETRADAPLPANQVSVWCAT